LLASDRVVQKDRLLRQAESHISVLHRMFEGCSAYAEAIRRDINEGIGGSLEQGKPLTSMSEPDQVRIFLATAGVPERLTDEILAVLIKLSRPSSAPTEAEVKELLTNAGILRSLIERESQPTGYLAEDGPGQRACSYIARMDEALLRVQTNRPEH